jgi:hypothetical protein
VRLAKGIQNLLRQNRCEGAKADSRAKFGKEAVAGVHSQNWFHIMVLRIFRLCSGSALACSPSAQVRAAVAHVRRLEWNQQKGKLILSLWVYFFKRAREQGQSTCFLYIWRLGREGSRDSIEEYMCFSKNTIKLAPLL